eukprot:CAMPEP_0170196670 /NCGR_PEP_ID=MMETSP0040_2-20121228/64504_1 /TAXON_ID=641309 /ORGANISM="Lotharella oceanica, Strain CCMP622" /LENGTH=96 /DNA_ID=CAMNT_0010446155 /DNA_START=460 /DNA_END=746 /DNA_ORIENTATION=-
MQQKKEEEPAMASSLVRGARALGALRETVGHTKRGADGAQHDPRVPLDEEQSTLLLRLRLRLRLLLCSFFDGRPVDFFGHAPVLLWGWSRRVRACG